MYKPKLRSSFPIFNVRFQKNASKRHDNAPIPNIIYIVKAYDTFLGCVHFKIRKTIGAICDVCVIMPRILGSLQPSGNSCTFKKLTNRKFSF